MRTHMLVLLILLGGLSGCQTVDHAAVGAPCKALGQTADAEVSLSDLLTPPGNPPLPIDEAVLHVGESGWGDDHYILIGPDEAGGTEPPDASLCVFGRQVELRSGYAYATGTFAPPPTPAAPGGYMPIIWPAIVTSMVAIGAEGTKVIVHIGDDGVHRVFRLAEGGGIVYVWEHGSTTYTSLAGNMDQMIEHNPATGGLGQAVPIDSDYAQFIAYVKNRAKANNLP